MAFIKSFMVGGQYYVAQVRTFNGKGEVTHYETPEYYTEQMANADAECWLEFHMNQTPEKPKTTEAEFTIEADDKVYSRSGNAITGEKFATHLRRVQLQSPDVTFKVYPFSQSTKKGFHLDIIYPGNAPTRKFTIHKADQS